jgi:hypothetical protein
VKTQGELDAAVCDAASRLEQECMGRGLKDIHAFLIGDPLMVRLQGVLTAAEQRLAKTPLSRETKEEVTLRSFIAALTSCRDQARPPFDRGYEERLRSSSRESLAHDISGRCAVVAGGAPGLIVRY